MRYQKQQVDILSYWTFNLAPSHFLCRNAKSHYHYWCSSYQVPAKVLILQDRLRKSPIQLFICLPNSINCSHTFWFRWIDFHLFQPDNRINCEKKCGMINTVGHYQFLHLYCKYDVSILSACTCNHSDNYQFISADI